MYIHGRQMNLPMPYAFILNPTAGSGYAKQVMQKIAGMLDEWRMEYRILETTEPGNATEIARNLAAQPEITTVVAVGGDGTASEVAAGLSGTGKAMGIIPAGTGNDFIKTVRIPKDPAAAMKFMLDRPPRPVDTGSINDNFFLNVCGTGFDVTVLECAEEKKKNHRGLMPYFLGLLQAIRVYAPSRLQITFNQREENGDYLVCSIANGKIIGGGIPICPAAEVRDGKLDLVMIRNVPRWRIPFYLPGLMMAKDLTFHITEHVRTEHVTIRGQGLKFNIDGEIRRMDEARFKIRPQSLMLIC